MPQSRKFFAGNLYWNRKCTGALVGAPPSGGFNRSGADSQAGGRDCLLLFTQAQRRRLGVYWLAAGKAKWESWPNRKVHFQRQGGGRWQAFICVSGSFSPV